MPKVSEAHKEARRQQVLSATLRCVEREGFHKTTMAAVIRESGLSAGAVYLYFKGKQDLIRAIAETAVSGVASTIRELAEAEETVPPHEAMEIVARRLLELSEEHGVEFPRIALQSWAEAARDPEVRDIVHQEAQRIREAWIAYAVRAIDAGHLAADADPSLVGQALMSMLPGFMLFRVVLGEVSPEEHAAGLRDLLRQPS